jgi:hypothetical protein
MIGARSNARLRARALTAALPAARALAVKGFARYLSEALPNAQRLGFTGTPVSFGGRPRAGVEDQLACPGWCRPLISPQTSYRLDNRNYASRTKEGHEQEVILDRRKTTTKRSQRREYAQLPHRSGLRAFISHLMRHPSV